MNKSNKKLVFLFTKINKKQRTKIHPAIINNKTNRKWELKKWIKY